MDDLPLSKFGKVGKKKLAENGGGMRAIAAPKTVRG